MAIKDKFNCFGYFYNINKDEKNVGECRSILEIVRKDSNIDVKLDAIAIMMNPGNSKPLTGNSVDIDSVAKLQFTQNNLVLTDPDNTQSRIMGIMNSKNWNRVRVINLSDLREKDHTKLKEKIAGFEDVLGNIHSIFSDDRKSELEKYLVIEDVPLILAWGCKSHLEELAEKCLHNIEDKIIIGVASAQSEKLFQHPLARVKGSSWKKEILKQLEEIS